MQFRKFIFAVLALAALAGSCFVAKRGQNAAFGTQLVVDGGDPVPLPYPTETTGLAISGDVNRLADGSSVQLADGGDPVPLPYPKPKATGIEAGHKGISGMGALLADGGDPVPLPYPKPTKGLGTSADANNLGENAGALLADRRDPLPLSYRHRLA